jgi:2,3-bisphosphoglycerate-dependent phosphoglycerate mutase
MTTGTAPTPIPIPPPPSPPTETATRLVLIRHGESQAQVDQLVSCHDTCEGLSDRGRAQAAALRDRLLASGELGRVDAVYTSVLARSIETAEILAPALGADLVPEAECAWCEIHPGEAEGWAHGEIRALLGRAGLVDPTDRAFHRVVEGGESWAECFARLGSRLRRAARDHTGGCVVVVGHGGTVGAGFVAFGGVPLGAGPGYTQVTENTSITEWIGTGGAWQLARFNDAAHLAPLRVATTGAGGPAAAADGTAPPAPPG